MGFYANPVQHLSKLIDRCFGEFPTNEHDKSRENQASERTTCNVAVAIQGGHGEELVFRNEKQKSIFGLYQILQFSEIKSIDFRIKVNAF